MQLFCRKPSLSPERRSCLENPRVINHMSSSGSTCSSYVNASVREELPSVPPLCPPAQRWQMWPPQWKYWESPGHLSGNIWAIWTITFCKWTQIKMYVVAFPGASASLLRFIPQPPLKYYHDVICAIWFFFFGGGLSQVCGLSAARSTQVDRGGVGRLCAWASEKLQVVQGFAISGRLKERKIKTRALWKQGCLKCLHDMRWPVTHFCSVNKLQAGSKCMQYPLIYVHAVSSLLCARWKLPFPATCPQFISHEKPVDIKSKISRTSAHRHQRSNMLCSALLWKHIISCQFAKMAQIWIHVQDKTIKLKGLEGHPLVCSAPHLITF